MWRVLQYTAKMPRQKPTASNSFRFDLNWNVCHYKHALMLVLFLLGLSVCYTVVVFYTTRFEKVITVKEKYIRYRRRSSSYNVVDVENNVYQMGNLWFLGDFNRSNDYAQMNTGGTYRVKGYGYRSGFFDKYQTIYDVQKIDSN